MLPGIAGREEPFGRPNKGPGEAGGSEHLFQQSDPPISLDYDQEKEAARISFAY